MSNSLLKTIEMKATGERMTFLKSAADTHGEYVEILAVLPASGEGPPTHRHVFQTELFEAIEGRLGLECNGRKIILEPGQSFTVPMNVFHRCYSVDEREIQFRAVFRPALNIEYFLTEMFESCNRNNSKEPSPFDACYILQEVKGEYYLKDIPLIIQKTVFPFVASVGRVLGLIKSRKK